jgi:hypothetical protein
MNAPLSHTTPPPPSEPEPPPTLDPATVADDDLVETIEIFIAADTVAQERLDWIAYHRDLLRQALDATTLGWVLDIHRMADEREDHLRVALVRWAFDVGRRFPLPAGEVST